MKIAINQCFGGFSLSPLAIKMLAERKGKKAYFFKALQRTRITLEQASKGFFFVAYSVPNPYKVAGSQENWWSMTDEERKRSNQRWNEISLKVSPEDRADPDLIYVIEKLGKKASSKVSNIGVVEIPDGVKYTIEEYDGNEWIAEEHRTWGR